MQPPTFRPVDPNHDFPALAELLNKVRIQKVSAARLQEWQVSQPSGRLRRDIVAVSAENTFIGRSLLEHRPSAADGRFTIDIIVHPDHRRQGLGAILYEDAYQFARTNNGRILDADVCDNCSHCLQFAEKRGFVTDCHLFESSLDLRTFDPLPFSRIVKEVEASGIRFFSLAEAGNTEAIRRQLYDVNRQVSLDSPSSHGTFPTYEEFSSITFNASWFLPKGQILAADGDKIIGLAAVGYFAEENLMENLITGVLPAHRGRRIAQALKAITLRCAISLGAASIRTHNDSQNEPMLAINRKFGYQPQVGEYRLIRRL